jgi:chromosome condensin MukBEF MukE localization factor
MDVHRRSLTSKVPSRLAITLEVSLFLHKDCQLPQGGRVVKQHYLENETFAADLDEKAGDKIEEA